MKGRERQSPTSGQDPLYADPPGDVPAEPSIPKTEPPAHEIRRIPTRKLYQDEIYGTKELTPLIVALVDTPEVQRLGHIYQLGFTYTIFRGANHNRFDHCVGTSFMVRTILRRVVQNHARLYDTVPEAFAHPGLKLSPRFYMDAPGTPPGRQGRHSPMGRWRGLTELVSAAGLLHDLGHVPVGHTLEDEFSVLEKHDSLGGPRLFEMLYGPRTAISPVPTASGNATPNVERFFSPINTDALPRPESWQRVPLPWVFEDHVYERFLPDVTSEDGEVVPIPGIQNWEIRDLIYLILSFKETTTDRVYITFRQELNAAIEKAQARLNTAIEEAQTRNATTWLARLRFLEWLYDHYSTPFDVGQDHEALPMFYPFMADTVGNTICADLLDYLIRDGKRLKLDIRDNARLQRYLVIRPASSFVRRNHARAGEAEPSESLRLTIYAVHRNGLRRRDTVSDLLDLMRERHRFAEVVYYHPKKAAFSTMLVKAMELLEDSKPVDGDGIYPAPWASRDSNINDRPHIVHLGDKDLLSYLTRQAETRAGTVGKHESMASDLLRGIHYRNEYRRLFTLDYEAARTADGPQKFIEDLRSSEGGVTDAGRKRMERILARVVNRSKIGEWKYDENTPVLIYCPSVRMQAKEVAAHVELVRNHVTPLNLQEDDDPLRGEIELLNRKYRHLWRLYLFIHPRLVATCSRDAEGMRALSTLIDTFCLEYAVNDEQKSKGCRYDYVPFVQRIEAHFQRWQVQAPPGMPRDAVLTRARDLDMWGDIVGSKEAPFPVEKEEYDGGFMRAAIVAAADTAKARERSGWPAEVRPLRGEQWHRRIAVARAETARVAAVSRFNAIGLSVADTTNPARQAYGSWDEFRGYVITALRGGRGR